VKATATIAVLKPVITPPQVRPCSQLDWKGPYSSSPNGFGPGKGRLPRGKFHWNNL